MTQANPLDFWESYSACVQRTASLEPKISTYILGLLGESGEVCDLVKKFTGHGREWDDTRMVEELGDVLWYCSATYTYLLPFEKFRYAPEGKADFRVYPLKKLGEGQSRDQRALSLCVELSRVCFDFAHCLNKDAEHTAIYKIEHILQAVSNFNLVVEAKPTGGRFGDSFLGVLAEANIAKLAKRYPHKFTLENERVNQAQDQPTQGDPPASP